MTVPTQVVGPVVERMTARRIEGAGIGLSLAAALALVEFALVDRSPAIHGTALVGPILSGAVLLTIGFRGVRRGFGDPVRPWMTLASASVVIPLAFGLWVFTILGLRSFAYSDGPSLAWALYAAWTGVGLRILRDTSRVVEVERFASTMIVPAPGESADAA